MQTKYIIRVQRKDDMPGFWRYLNSIGESTIFISDAATFTNKSASHNEAQMFLDTHPQFGRTRVEHA